MGTVATIGLISDTHGLMRREALAALQGSDLIIHAGMLANPRSSNSYAPSRHWSPCEETSIKAFGRPACR